jgi:hypothetical protein
MRHSTIDLTMNTYTDPKLLDIQGAMERLPALPLERLIRSAARATGTDDDSGLAPALAPKTYRSGASAPFPVKSCPNAPESPAVRDVDVSSSAVKRNHPLTDAVNGCHGVERSTVKFVRTFPTDT